MAMKQHLAEKKPKCRKCGVSERYHLNGEAMYFETKTRTWIVCTNFVAAGDGQTEPSGNHKA